LIEYFLLKHTSAKIFLKIFRNMGLATSTVKHLLLVLNFIFAILGLILIGFGIFILVSAAQNTFDHGENWAGGLIIALGVITVSISLFGCLAAIHESRKKLTIYIIILIVLVLVQLLMTGMASQGTRDGLSGSVHDGFEKLWKYEMDEPGSLAYYEDWLHCCGVNSTEDYRNVGHEIPKTCCKVHICTRENVYRVGCQVKFE